MMKKSLFFKLFLATSLFTIAISLLVLFSSFTPIREHYTAVLTEDLENLAATLSMNVVPFLGEKRYGEMDAYLKTLDKRIHRRITVVDLKGNVLADSEKDPGSMGNHSDRPEIAAVLNGKVGTSLRFSSTIREEMLYVALPVTDNGRTIGVLRVSMFLKDINTLLGRLKNSIALIVLASILVSLPGLYFLSRRFLMPVRLLAAASQKVASGDFSAKVLLRQNDELRELADSFNNMTDQIRSLFHALSAQKEDLDTVLSSLQEGLVVFDRTGKIRLANAGFRKMFFTATFEGRFYWEVLRNQEFDRLLHAVTDSGASSSAEIELDGRIFLCSIAAFGSRGEFVAVLHDITPIKQVERVKKDFVANVSHELRTPLTAISGFIETMEEEADGDNLHYLEIIKRHTRRLISIVEDLLLLSDLEAKGAALQSEAVSLPELIGNLSKIFEQKLKDRDLILAMDCEVGATVRGDTFKLEQLFLNLIDNAIKYTEKGSVSVSVRKNGDFVETVIRDTGIGIPREHLDRIFERFYVVDKSRSRKAGGTGLGLSIVKHIVLMHGGTIAVESIPGKGSTFTVRLPAA